MVRVAQLADLAGIVQVEKEAFPLSAWGADVIADALQADYCHFLVSVVNDEIIGCAGMNLLYEAAEILTLGVRTAYRRQGYGQELLTGIIDLAKAKGALMISLEARVSNQAAIALYEKNGFVRVAIRKQYYENNEDAYLMILDGRQNR